VWSRKWRESWERDIEEEVVLAAVQETVLRESKEEKLLESQIALAMEAKEANEEKEQELEGQWRRRTRGVGG
jgi:hypothetical protein